MNPICSVSLGLVITAALGGACQSISPKSSAAEPTAEAKASSPAQGASVQEPGHAVPSPTSGAASAQAAPPAVSSPQIVGGARPGAAGLRTKDGELFGAEFQGAPKADLARLLKDPEAFAGKPVTVSGHVRQVCQRKGCWMEISATADPKAPACRVKFKDYGFFVPTNSTAAQVTLEGELAVQRVSASRVAHLEQEGATFTSKNADGSANETQLLATAVLVKR